MTLYVDSADPTLPLSGENAGSPSRRPPTLQQPLPEGMTQKSWGIVYHEELIRPVLLMAQ